MRAVNIMMCCCCCNNNMNMIHYTETCVRLRGGEASGTMLHLPGSHLATVPRAEAEAAGLGSVHLSAAALQHQPVGELSAPFSYRTSHG